MRTCESCDKPHKNKRFCSRECSLYSSARRMANGRVVLKYAPYTLEEVDD